MAQLQSRSRRWATATRWPVGIALAGWRYMWSTTPVHRSEMGGSWPEDAPPDLPENVGRSELQKLADGAGPLTHRTYRTRIVGSPFGAEELMAEVTADLDRVAPSEFAAFQQVGDDEGEGLAVGDEYVVRMPGPWDGPVRVVTTDATSFRLATLPGHLEAGQIEFRVRGDYRSLWFEIESWARSGDRTSDLLYDRFGFSKEVQLHMWSSVLRKVVDLAGGRIEGGLVITTRRVPEEELPDEDATEPAEGLRGPDHEQLRELAGRPVNIVDPDTVMEPRPGGGWHQDDLIEELPAEPSGPPVEGGSWQIARRLINDYQLADPTVVTATYDSRAPLEGRDMLLRISFRGLRFRVGVRVGEVIDEERRIEGQPVQIFGWSYDTLEGHFEEGRMFYELWKWLETGDVEFRLRAVSRPARSASPIIRFGLRLLGRSQQVHFYAQICRRVRTLTETRIETERIAELAARD